MSDLEFRVYILQLILENIDGPLKTLFSSMFEYILLTYSGIF